MKKIFYLYDSDASHISVWAKKEIEKIFKEDGRFSLDSGCNVEKISKKYDVVVVFTGCESSRTFQKDLISYVESGGSIVYISPSPAAGSLEKKAGIKEIKETTIQQFNVMLEKKGHYLCKRFPAEFQMNDAFFTVETEGVETFFSTPAGNVKSPVVFIKEDGRGKICCIMAGKTKNSWMDFNFKKLFLRSVAYLAGEKEKDKVINCGLVGYGPIFNMRKRHGN